ncbi:MAG TPA: response regulator transcription factor [Gammaproteobacteria bacterium]
MPRILVVEDNKEILSNITMFLEHRNYTVDCADNGMTAMYLIGNNRYDVVVLDIMLPGDANGYDICNTMRQCNNNTPVIMLTAKDSVEERLEGFDSGADDYLVKPFSLDELEARIKALHKRSTGVSTNLLTVGDLSFNTETYLVVRQGQEIELNPTLYKLLEILMKNSPNVVKKEVIEHYIWGDDIPESDVLKTTVHMLRKKVDGPFNKPLIQTMRGIGYSIK